MKTFLAALLLAAGPAAAYTPVITPNGSTLKWELKDGVKEFRLTVEPCEHELAPGSRIKAWCYNGQTPGPTIEAVEGDRVRILVTNKLPEPTAVHWHGLLLPSGMDGVTGLNQEGIPPGDTFAYEFTLQQHGTQMYHSHADEMVQIGLGTMGFFVIHPKERKRRIDRDYALMLNEWAVHPGTSRPDPSVMTDFDLFTFNSRAFPGTAPLAAKPGERVRVRIGNVSQDCHPVHMHGHTFKIVATDGGDIPESAQWPETTVVVCPGQTRDFEFTAIGGDWAIHCHKRHHPMNPMGHGIPNMLGVDQAGVAERISKSVPGYMPMGEKGMHEHAEHAKHMEGPENTLPMMGGDGPFGSLGMGGMFTVVKVHDDEEAPRDAAEYMRRVKLPGDLGWFKNPPGTVARSVNPPKKSRGPGPAKTAPPTKARDAVYSCPMHPDVKSDKPGRCPKCGMDLVPAKAGQEGHEGH
jgi:manganese oxidase